MNREGRRGSRKSENRASCLRLLPNARSLLYYSGSFLHQKSSQRTRWNEKAVRVIGITQDIATTAILVILPEHLGCP